MTTMAVPEFSSASTAKFRSPRRPPGAIAEGSSAAAVLALQRAAGNHAVTRQLGLQRPPIGVPSDAIAVVQRCGATPCDCSSYERAKYAANHSDGQTVGHTDGDDLSEVR